MLIAQLALVGVGKELLVRLAGSGLGGVSGWCIRVSMLLLLAHMLTLHAW